MAKITVKRISAPGRDFAPAPLYAVLSVNREKVRIPLKIHASPSEWDDRIGRFRGRSQRARDNNLIIDNSLAKITEILVRARLSGDKIDSRRLRQLYSSPISDGNFINFALNHLQTYKEGLQWSSQRHHQAILEKLKSYQPNLLIADITPEFLRNYAIYLRDELGNCPGTVNKNLCVIRLYYYAAIRAGLTTSNPFAAYKIPQPRPVTVFLTDDEFNKLTTLYKLGTLKDTEQDVLRFFLFMAFTGMHITDARMLQIEQIFGDEIHYKRIKTRVDVVVPVSVPARKIINYYAGGRHKGPLCTNIPTDQSFNRVIKIICRRIGITKAVSAKAARHTFATIYYRRNRGDLGTLSKLLGHSSVATTMIYAHIIKEDRQKGMSVFDEML